MHKQPAQQCPWLGTAEVATMLGVTDETIRCWIHRGIRPMNCAIPIRLRCTRLGKRYRIRREWLDEFQQALDAGTGVEVEVPKVEPVDEQRERAIRAKEEAARRLGRRGVK